MVVSRRRKTWLGLSDLGIAIVILSTVHIPLPRADYHNIRHHDAPGEICVYHDHLLRWHPLADLDEDVTMLHWHWVIPSADLGDHHQGSDDEHQGSGPSLHAHWGDLPAPNWQTELASYPDSQFRLFNHLMLGQCAASLGGLAAVDASLDPPPRALCSRTQSAWGELHASRFAFCQRWNC